MLTALLAGLIKILESVAQPLLLLIFGREEGVKSQEVKEDNTATSEMRMNNQIADREKGLSDAQIDQELSQQFTRKS